MIRAEYQLTAEDVKVAHFAHALGRGARWMRVLFLLLGLALLALASLTFGSGQIVVGILMLALGLYLPVMEPLGRFLRARRMLRALPLDERGFRFEFDDTALQYSNQNLFSARYNWDLIKSVREYRGVFLIYPKADLDFCYILPARAFATQDDLEQFRLMLAQKQVAFGAIR